MESSGPSSPPPQRATPPSLPVDVPSPHLVGLLLPPSAEPSSLLPTDPAPYLAALSTDPAPFHAGGLHEHYYHTGTSLSASSLLPGSGYYNPAARPTDSVGPRAHYYDAAAFHAPRPTDTVGVRALVSDPRASLAGRYTHPGDLLATSSTTIDLGVLLGMRVSQALRLGEHPPPPINATTEAPQPMTWVLGASTGDFTTPFGTFRPRRSSAIHTLRSSQPHFGATPTSPQAIYISGASSHLSSAAEAFVSATIASSPRRASSSPAVPAFHTPRGGASLPSEPHFNATPTPPPSSSLSTTTGASSGLNLTAQRPFYPTAASSHFRSSFGPMIASSPVRATSRTYEDIRMKVLQDNPMDVALLTRSGSAGHIIGLLEGGDQETRLRLLAGIRLHLHKLMENKSGSVVFGSVLRSCKGNRPEIYGVVQAFVQPNDTAWRRWIMRRAEDSDDIWLGSFKMLFSAISEDPELCETIVNCLVRENIICNARGADLLKICISLFPYDQAKILIQQAIEDMKRSLHKSQFGSKFLEECFVHAQADELRELEEAVLYRAKEMAKGQYSNYLLQHAVKHGTDGFLHSILSSFLQLAEADMDELVTGRFSSFSIHTMLNTGKSRLPAMARRLAESISMLAPNILHHPNARLVIKSMKKALDQ